MDSRMIFALLQQAYGEIKWWPGDPYAIMAGAVLTQNTTWKNVEKSLALLGTQLQPLTIAGMSEAMLQQLIVPSGFYRAKAATLKRLTAWYGRYDFLPARVQQKTLLEVRTELLALKGIGPETADDILTYAFQMPSFVIDAYTRRLLDRLGMVFANDLERRRFLTANLPEKVEIYAAYHGAIVEHCKRHCAKKPVCAGCVFTMCRYRSVAAAQEPS